MHESARLKPIGSEVGLKALLLLIPFLAFLCSVSAGSNSFVGKCLTVIDGDTVDVSRDGNTIRIRIEGIDCPEKNQPFAAEAKAFTTNLVLGKTVSVIEKEKDEFGRTVARVFIDGRDVSVELLKVGLATHYKKYNSDWLLAALEKQAKANKVGMWAVSTETPQVEEPVSLPASGATRAVTATGSATQVIYHGNVSSRVFHSPSCRYFNCKNCTQELRSREEALAAGFRPCGICKP
jgi:micrococcal nuclease